MEEKETSVDWPIKIISFTMSHNPHPQTLGYSIVWSSQAFYTWVKASLIMSLPNVAPAPQTMAFPNLLAMFFAHS